LSLVPAYLSLWWLHPEGSNGLVLISGLKPEGTFENLVRVNLANTLPSGQQGATYA
jgi:hypothetical protein